jgi:TRAP transporter T-component
LLIAIGKWEEYIEKDPSNKHVFGMLARAHYLLGNGHETDEAAMLAAYDKGASYSERGMALNEDFRLCVDKGGKDYKCLSEHMTNDDILSVYWAYANVGKWSAISGFTYIVKNKSKLKGISDWVQATDPNFYYGAGDRILGTYYAKAPAAFGGDLDLSLNHFNMSLKIEPNYLGTKVLMAQYYCPKAQDKELFIQLLNEVIAADPDSIPEIRAEQVLDQANAQKLLDQVDDLF